MTESTSTGAEALPPIVFLHIPKAAGSTLNRIQDGVFGEGEVFQHKVEEGQHCGIVWQRSPEELRGYRLLRGHLPLSWVAQTYQDAWPRCLTVLREPVPRVISHFNYVRRMDGHKQHAIAQGTLGEFIEQAGTDVDNLQVRLLSGHNPWSVPKGECPAEWLDDARRNLREKIEVVGVSEQFDAFLVLLEHAFGWPAHVYKRENVTSKRETAPEIDPAVLARIAELNQLDTALHAEAAAIQEQRFAALPAGLQAKWRRLQRRQKLVQLCDRAGLLKLASAARGTVRKLRS